MTPPPPVSTRPDTRFPFPALVRARGLARRALAALALAAAVFRDRRVEADRLARREAGNRIHHDLGLQHPLDLVEQPALFRRHQRQRLRSEEHTSELQSLMRISYPAFCMQKTTNITTQHANNT